MNGLKMGDLDLGWYL